jgi:hypothetical protein
MHVPPRAHTARCPSAETRPAEKPFSLFASRPGCTHGADSSSKVIEVDTLKGQQGKIQTSGRHPVFADVLLLAFLTVDTKITNEQATDTALAANTP